MKHFFYVTLLCALVTTHLAAQDQPSPADSAKVSGLVVSANDTIPLPGVKVSIKGTDVSAVTDATGRYTLPVRSTTDTLIFSVDGYKSALTAVSGRKAVNIMLNPKDADTPPPAIPDATTPADSTRVAPDATDSTRVAQQDSTAVAPPDSVNGKIRVTGTVVSETDKTAIPGVSVLVKNTSTGVVTDVNGKYTIHVNATNDVLVFSFVGLQSKEVPLNGQTTVDASLAEEGKVLKEVVVVGYGTMDRATLTSSVSTIGSEMLDKDPLPSVSQAIQGKAGGVQVTQKSGSPGGGVNIRIRGTTSINASSDPLYVVDGIPVNSTTNFIGASDFNFGGGTQGINILASINPGDIESVEILKDAASSSIYGARAANGVVLITTKRGKANETNISVNAYAGVSTMPSERKYDLMNTPDYISYMQDYYAIKGTPLTPESSILRSDINTDWQDEIFRTAPIQNYELNASGGADKTQYYTSIGYYDQQGIILNSGFKRLSARMNLDYQQSDKLKFTSNINLTRAINDRVQEENSKEGSTKNGIATPPNVPVYNEDGSWAYDPSNGARENPVAMLKLPVNTAETFRILGNIGAEYEIMKGLSFKTTWGVDMSYIDENFFMPPKGIRSFAAQGGMGASRSTKDQLWINENTLTFDRMFNKNHHINLLGGISFQESKYSFVEARRNNFASNDIPVISVGGSLAGANASVQEWAIASYFARVNYGYKNKYLLTANFRIDGSSRFGADNRYGTFPSVAAAWRASEETFIKDVAAISNLKLRASWGLTGNQNIPNYASYTLYSAGSNYLNTPGFYPTTLGDANLGWETTEQIDIGLDLGILKDRISLLADYYVKNTSDLLISVQTPRTSGFASAIRNVGEIQNKGFEFELTTRNLVGDFRWTTSLNMTFNRNKVVSLPNGDIYGGLGNLNIAREGLPLGSFYGWEMVGVNPQTGMIDFAHADGSVGAPSAAADKRIIGNPNPDFFGGITNTFFYKGFDLSIMGQFSYGNDIFNYNLFTVLSGSNDSNNGLTDWNRRWRNPGDITDVPRPTPSNLDNATISSRFVEDGSFFRLRNITLGYTFPAKWTDRLKIKSLRVYATVQNAHVFTKYRGYDPEVSSSPGGANTGLVYGFDYGSYPQPRVFTGGLNLTF